MNKLLSLLALATFAFGQDTTVPSYDVKGCWKGETSTVSMLNMTASYKDDKAVFEAEASKACFDFCAGTVSAADVRANWFNKSNRRKNRVQCKCLMKDSVETLTMTCEDLPDPSMEELAGNSPAGKGNGKGKGKGKGKGQGMGRKLLKKGGKGKLKKCLKCHALSGTPPVTPPPTV